MCSTAEYAADCVGFSGKTMKERGTPSDGQRQRAINGGPYMLEEKSVFDHYQQPKHLSVPKGSPGHMCPMTQSAWCVPAPPVWASPCVYQHIKASRNSRDKLS